MLYFDWGPFEILKWDKKKIEKRIRTDNQFLNLKK